MYGNPSMSGMGIQTQPPGPQAGVTTMPSNAGAANPNALPPVQRPPVSAGPVANMAGNYGGAMLSRIGASEGIGGPSNGAFPPELLQALMAARARLGGGGAQPMPPTVAPPVSSNPGPVQTMTSPPTPAPPVSSNPGPVVSAGPPGGGANAGAAPGPGAGGPPPGSPFSPDEWAAIQARFAARGGLFDQLGTSAGYAPPPQIQPVGTTY